MIISAPTDYREAARRRLPPFLFHYIGFLFAHSLANRICPRKTVTGKVSSNLHNLLLIYNAAISHIKYVFKKRMLICYISREIFIFYISRNLFHRARSVK